MFSFSYNYILFFFNYELIIPTCFFFFLFFVLISDQGQVGNSLKELSIESKLKLIKYLEIREKMIKELASYLDASKVQMKRISMSYEMASIDISSSIQYTIKKASINYTLLQIKYFHDILIYRTNLLSLDIKQYFTQDLFSEKPYNLSSLSSSKLKILA